jgi:hypothetical protein
MHKGELKARDGRMSVVNELIGAVRFFLFFVLGFISRTNVGQVHQILCMGRALDPAGA